MHCSYNFAANFTAQKYRNAQACAHTDCGTPLRAYMLGLFGGLDYYAYTLLIRIGIFLVHMHTK